LLALQRISTVDSLTHIVLGACIGEATAGKSLGKRAMWLGAFAQTIPDLDFLAHFWLKKTDDIISHRGITHSLLFAFLVTLLLAEVSKKLFPKRPLARVRWWLLFGINLFTHIFIDSFNAYGVGWFEPFSHVRISFHVLFVADPFFSLWPFIAFIILWITKLGHRRRHLSMRIGIGIPAIYLVYAIANKLIVDGDLRQAMREQGISDSSYLLTPTPLNSWLWYFVARDSSGYFTAYRSVFHNKKDPIHFSFHPRNDSLLDLAKNDEEKADLLRFAQGYYTLEKWNDTIVFNVLRFGQVAGWYDPTAPFAFHYYLDKPGANEMVTQRGRLAAWNRKTFKSFTRQIAGQ
jgi:inner membrane protein